MDYEKKYKEALERARQFSEHPLQEDSSNIVEYIFPELKESGDIRKRIIDALHGDVLEMSEIKEAVAWLEKQGEPTDNDMVEALRTEYEKGRADAFAEMQKEWSEDDEKRLQSCINILKAKSLMGKVDTVNTMWLKSLKQRIGG